MPTGVVIIAIIRQCCLTPTPQQQQRTFEAQHAGLRHMQNLDVGVQRGSEIKRLAVGVDHAQGGAQLLTMKRHLQRGEGTATLGQATPHRLAMCLIQSLSACGVMIGVAHRAHFETACL
jgi:hypothetical protein